MFSFKKKLSALALFIALIFSTIILLENDSENLTQYIDDSTGYEILRLENSHGIIEIDLGILEESVREDFIQLEVKNSLDQLKAFSVKNMNEIKEVNIRFFPISNLPKIVRFFSPSNSTRVVAKIRVVNKTLYKIPWATINVNDIPSVVDDYFYNG